MTPAEFDHLRRFLRLRSGIQLSGEKQYLVESRLLPLARQLGLGDVGAVIARLGDPRELRLAEAVVEAMTTNETSFFRDRLPFEDFARTVLPELIAARAASRRLRIWCAAASTGQEPYSLAMLLAERRAELAGWRVEILGTDLSNAVLERARAGLYSQFEAQRGLSVHRLMAHFDREGDAWRIAKGLREAVIFRKLNLLDPFDGLGVFDVVFCRNVLIYFDTPTRADVLARLAARVAPGGCLYLGAGETGLGLTDALRPVPGRHGLHLRADERSTARGVA